MPRHHFLRLPLNVLTVCVLVALSAAIAHAAGVPTIVIKTSRVAVLNDGRDSNEVIADVRDSTGAFVPDNTFVTFTTSIGQINGPSSVATRAGSARIRITSVQKGTATLTASVPGGGLQQASIVFTDDPTETYQGNSYVEVLASGSLSYYPGDRVIEASGKARAEGDKGLPGASLIYRNLHIFADIIQLDCKSNEVHARGNVRVTKGGKRLECARLYLPLTSGDGFAVVDKDKKISTTRVKANDLSLEPAAGGAAPRYFDIADYSEAPQVIYSRQIRFFPGEKLQFTRPKFYQDGAVLFSIPYYSLALYSNKLFTDQFVSVGTQGLGLDLPFYYDMSPGSTGTFHIRHGEQSGRSAFATRPGWALDLIQSYNSNGDGRRYTGEIGLTGISGSDWGVRWNHSHEFAGDTRTSFYLDLPQHRSLFGSANISKQLGPLRAGLNLSGNRSLAGVKTSGMESDAYLETNPRKVGKTGYMMAVGATANVSRTNTLGFANNSTSHGLQTRFFSSPFRLDKQTSVTNYMSIGQLWADQGRGGPSFLSSLTATRILGPGANLQLTYDYAKQPVLYTETGSHRLSANLSINSGTKWNLFVISNTVLDARNSSLMADFNYSIAPRWRFNLSATMQRFSTAQYRDYAIGFARNIAGRDFVLSYSTFSHRIFFNIEASRF